MSRHLPASPGPRVAGNETLARIRSVRVHLGAGSATRTLVDDVNFDLRRGERLGVTGGEVAGTGALVRALSGCGANGETVVDGILDLHGTVSRLTDGVGSVRLVAVQGGVDRVDAVHRERAEILRALRDRCPVIIVDQSDDLPRDLLDEPNTAFLNRTFTDHDSVLVLVTDDLDVLRRTCDTVQVLLAGRIVERGPAVEVLTRPRHRYTQMLVDQDAGPVGRHVRRSAERYTPTVARRSPGCASRRTARWATAGGTARRHSRKAAVFPVRSAW